MKKTIFSILSLLALALCANAQSTINYGYYHGSEDTGPWGTGKAETYNIAIHVNDASLVGKSVKSLIVPVVPEATAATSYTAFLTRELKVSAGKAVADIASVEFEPNGEWTKVTLAEPYVIEEGGFYAGYSFKVSSVADAVNEEPVLLMVGGSSEGFYLATSRTYRKWVNFTGTLDANSPLQLEIEGDFKANSCSPVALPDKKVKELDGFTLNATIGNHGTEAVKNFVAVFSMERDGKSVDFEYPYTLPEPLSADFYGNTADVTFEVPAGIFEKGTYNGTLEIREVNGVPNPEASLKASNTVQMMTVVPFKRPLMEEFTGTWCGYCPRGWVAMRVLNEKYPDRFIAVSYHNGDAMQIHAGSSTDPYPLPVSGFPYANFDRVHPTDPYFGDGNASMGVESLWKTLCDGDTPANIEVEAVLTANNSISATAKVTFVRDLAEVPYRVAYMVTADGLTGETSNWIQHSYFSGAAGYGPEMDQFTQGESSQKLDFDDVIIANTDYNGIVGSLPETVTEGKELTHSCEFALETMVSNYGDKEYLVQDKNRLNVVALVVNTTTGEVVNAAKCRVSNPTGISVTENANRKVKSTDYFDLSGRKLSSAPARGMYIKSVVYSDGTKSVRKINK